jgi:hypothetical protein
MLVVTRVRIVAAVRLGCHVPRVHIAGIGRLVPPMRGMVIVPGYRRGLLRRHPIRRSNRAVVSVSVVIVWMWHRSALPIAGAVRVC